MKASPVSHSRGANEFVSGMQNDVRPGVSARHRSFEAFLQRRQFNIDKFGLLDAGEQRAAPG
jgi:hypothetical protein